MIITTPRRANMSSESGSSASTVHYAKPVLRHVPMPSSTTPSSIGSSSSSSSSYASSTKQTPPRSPVIRYPTVVVSKNSIATPSSSLTPQGTPSYAVPVSRNQMQYSASKLQYEHMRHRCKMLDDENQKLMRMQSDVVNDANRRVQMHVNEIRMLKEDNRKLAISNKELRDLSCFLDDDRQKTRKLAREWQKFGRYTSSLMKQEVDSYHQKMVSIEEKLCTKEREVDELRQLCMYLDEQRQSLMSNAAANVDCDNESEDLGCGSSEQSGGSEGHNDEEKHHEFNKCFNKHKESTLRRIMATSMCSEPSEEEERREVSKRERSRLLGYIQSLENRIKHLEMSQNHESFWNSSSNVGSDCDEKTIIERGWLGEEVMSNSEDCHLELKPVMTTSSTSSSHIFGNDKCPMFDSMTSNMTSSGCTTYASSGTDGDSVFVIGDEIDIGNLEVRTLSRIDEEATSASDTLKESARMPPKIAPPICSSLVLTNFDNMSEDCAPRLMRSASETCRPTTTLISSTQPAQRSVSVEKNNNNNVHTHN
ncbi:PAC-1 interacting and coiled-coil domain-containing protein 1 [Caenorhabditis elegans]|uniref:PAC-1 interacting and coiled-coil domain-containing protein 1 n=2 Tax=Caenorhabditis elegans TaxID=6239 RepID=PICC1_CAEEL|nr:PAC-1 interacting and coiled-coil domain-containing protein 1 [Caenorhabditis elegans]H2KYP0.1 RecName: Full=PAC-1 interacting and coiled-coil domain-containing protein 1 [Caenorhabditis elegans]CCD64130.1 PAC-1 interacting and coiled-coil domain-containing protein 1 [Caenorhabditis elegans]|eukprot:NP_504560.1 PAC-1 interacting and coiled-coil domain-containing protein 1 [Caenorhabditis elegans]